MDNLRPNEKTKTPIARRKKRAVKGKKSARKTRGNRKRGTNPLLFFKRWPKWVVWTVAALLVVAYLFIFYYFFVDPYSFRWKSIYGEPVYPEGFDVHGIDISHYQGEIDWEVLRNADINSVPVSFVFIKGTEGTTILDDCFNLNFYEAKQSSIIRGVYHFFRPEVDAKQQALFFLKQVHLETGDLPPVLDVEKAGDLTEKQLQRAVLTWLRTVEGKYCVKPIIYTGYKFKMKYLNTDEFDDYPYWIAHYYVEELEYKGKWYFWQYTDRGSVEGVTGNVDCNLFNGSLQELMNLTIQEDSE